LPTRLPSGLPLRRKLIQAMKLDKKVSQEEVKFVLARRIGDVQFGCAVPERLLNDVLGR
jgi:3-dehydroquinate synthetase